MQGFELPTVAFLDGAALDLELGLFVVAGVGAPPRPDLAAGAAGGGAAGELSPAAAC